MIIKEPNNNFAKLIQILFELKGKEIFQAYHTYGSMFLFDIGQKSEKLVQDKLEFIGENTVIIENHTWNLLKNAEIVVSSTNDFDEIRKYIPNLVGNMITDFAFVTEENRLSFIFTNNFRLDIKLSGDEYRDLGIKLSNGNWIDIGPGNTWKEVTAGHIDE